MFRLSPITPRLLSFSVAVALTVIPFSAEQSLAGYRRPAAKYSAPYRSKYSGRAARYNYAPRYYVRGPQQVASPASAAAATAGKSAAEAAPKPIPRPKKVLTRDEVLNFDPEKLARAGRHLIVGYYNIADMKRLVEKQAISGIFITSRNVRGRKIADIAADINSLQDIRRAQGLPRLVVAADQEGGSVSRLSPPLKLQPSLSTILAPLKTDTEREKAVRAYAEEQARQLDQLGVTMNFGPVVDLRTHGPNSSDGETKLYWRAIDSDPYLVAKVAGWYCDTLTKWNIICTLKHFPGLGRVTLDTHVASAEIKAPAAQLALNDWVPFRRVMDKPGVATMIGHVRVDAIDKTTPASYSEPLIHSLVRTQWQNGSLLVTDDFSMGAITRSSDGVGGAALKALNAGADFVLISFSEQHYDTVISALLEAEGTGEFDLAKHNESLERMKRYLFVDDRTSDKSAKTAEQK